MTALALQLLRADSGTGQSLSLPLLRMDITPKKRYACLVRCPASASTKRSVSLIFLYASPAVEIKERVSLFLFSLLLPFVCKGVALPNCTCQFLALGIAYDAYKLVFAIREIIIFCMHMLKCRKQVLDHELLQGEEMPLTPVEG